jgi:predicted PurR-regulated permease PerM
MGFFSFKKQKHAVEEIEVPIKPRSFPFYIKAPLVLIGLYLFFYILFLLQDIIVPFAFAGLVAILLNPVYNRLEKWKVPKILAIILTLLTAIIVLAGILLFLSTQIIQFGDMIPLLKQKSITLLNEAQQWISMKFNVPLEKQMKMLNDTLNNSKGYLGQTLNTVFGVVSYFVLIPLYVFLLLFYKPLILNFIFEVFKEDNKEQVADILQQTKSAVQSYIVGLMIEACIIATLNSVALMILGVKYAILIGVIGAILNVIPYIGGVIAIAIPVLISFVTKDDGLTTPVLIVISYLVIQFIDNNIIVPRVVSSKVSVNALVSIIIVLLGGALWGVSGMFLSIPFVAVLKIIFDRINELKPWGKLLGEEMPKNIPGKVVIKEEQKDNGQNADSDDDKTSRPQDNDKKENIDS